MTLLLLITIKEHNLIIKYASCVNDIINEVGLLNAYNIAYSYSIAIKVKDAI